MEGDRDDPLSRWLDGEDDFARSSPLPSPPSPRFADFTPPPSRVLPSTPLSDGSGDAISSGSWGLDRALGTGGYPRGGLVELFGTAGSGKSTLALLAVAGAQAAGGVAALIDAEHSLDPAYAKRLGVDLGTLLVAQPDSGEEALEIGELLIRSNAVDLVAVDSVAALTPRVELENDLGQYPGGLQAELMSRALRRWSGALRRSRAVVLLINQIRYQLVNPFDDPETTAGGRALRFHAAQRISLTAEGVVGGEGHPEGVRVAARVVKNKRSAPFGAAAFDLLFAGGVDRCGEWIDGALSAGVLSERGDGWVVWGDRELGMDRRAVRDWFVEHPDEARVLRRVLERDGR